MADSLKIKKILFPSCRKLFLFSVIAGESMDSRLDQNKTILRVFVFSILFQMFADRNGLLDHVIKVFRDLRSTSYFEKLYHSSSKLSRFSCQ